MDFVSFNYHWQVQNAWELTPQWAQALRTLSDMWLAENAIQRSEVKLTNRLATPMTYK